MKAHSSKTTKLSETFSKPEVDNIENKAILRDFLQNYGAGGLVPIRFVSFPVHLSTVLRLPRKSKAKISKIILANLKI